MQVDVFEGVEIHLHPFTGQIDDLTADQAGSTSRQGELTDDLQQALSRHTRASQGDHLKGPS